MVQLVAVVLAQDYDVHISQNFLVDCLLSQSLKPGALSTKYLKICPVIIIKLIASLS